TMSFAAPRLSPSAAIRPPLMPTSQRNVSDAVATMPPRIIVSKLMGVLLALFFLSSSRVRFVLPAEFRPNFVQFKAFPSPHHFSRDLPGPLFCCWNEAQGCALIRHGR